MRLPWMAGALCALAGSASAQQTTTDTAVTDTAPAAVVQRFVDAANARDLAALTALVAPDAVFLRMLDGRVLAEGRDGIRDFYAPRLRELSPAYRIAIVSRIVEGPLVVDQEQFTGTPAEQGQATWMYEVRGGLIQRAWALGRRRGAAP
jgi:hypothetical protein